MSQNRCDPSIGPDTPINTPERLIYRLLPLRGWSVWRRSVKAADGCRLSRPDSRRSSRAGSPFLLRLRKCHQLAPRIQQLFATVQTKYVTEIVPLSPPFLPPPARSPSLPTKINSSGAQARYFSTKLSLIFQSLLTLRTQLPAYLQCVIRSVEECGRLCSGAIKQLPPL